MHKTEWIVLIIVVVLIAILTYQIYKKDRK
jgi:hypothetical protein